MTDNASDQGASKPILWKIVVGGVVFAAVILWVASVLDLQRVWQTLGSVNYPLAILGAVPVIASHWMRAVRWKTMLRSVPDLAPMPLLDLFSAIMLGYVANNIVPRSGEIVRPYIVARRHRLPTTLLLASVFAERLMDVTQLLFFLGVAMLLLPGVTSAALPPWLVGEGMRSLAIVLLVLAAGVVILGVTTIGERVAVLLVRLFSRQLSERIAAVFASFRRGLRIARSGGDVALLLVESVAIWVLYALPLWITLLAVPLHTPDSHAWTFADACIVLLAVAVGTTTAPTPGAIGVVHALVAEAMTRLYAAPLEEAFVFITVAHAVNYVSVMLVGGIFAAREGISLVALTRPALTSETAPSATEQTNA